MYSTFHGLEVGKRAIVSQQTALTVTGQNIANANTKGYTRQEAVLNATFPLSSPNPHNGTLPMQLGTGVEVSEFRRIRESYLDSQFQSRQQEVGYWDAKANSLSGLESIFNDLDETGMENSLQQFWQSLQELAKQPDNLSARVVTVSAGKDVAENLYQIYSDLAQIDSNITYQLSSKAGEINAAAKEIAALNLKIAQVTAGGNQPNDLMDRRGMLLDNLSRLINIDTVPGLNGQVNVSVAGAELVNGMDAAPVEIDLQNGTVRVNNASVTLSGGEVKGLLETKTETIPVLQAKINQLALAISDNMNAIHSGSKAVNLEDIQARKLNPNTPLQQLLFFVDKNNPTQPPTSAENIMVNPLLVQSPSRVAAASSLSTGDGSNAKAMSDVFLDKLDIGDTNTSISEFYKTIISGLGTEIQSAERSRDNADSMAQQIDNKRMSISGVSVDEELTNMVRYQQAYNAAARYVSAVNDMLDTLINGMK